MSLVQVKLHREIHFLEVSLGKSKKEVERKERQLKKLNEKLLQTNIIESIKLNTKGETN